MKISILLLTILSLCCNFTPTAFATTNNEILSKIENHLFGFEYTNENETTRVNRIEENVYGTTSSKHSLQQRISKLDKDMGSELYGQEIEPCEDTFAQIEDEQEVLSSESTNIDYPVINELEKSVFNQEYKNLGIKDRLSQLENKVFGKNFPNNDLSSRVDKLREQIKPTTLESTIADNQNAFNISGYYPPPINYDGMTIGSNSYSYSSDYYNNPNSIISSNKKINLSTVENALYSQNFKNDNLENRLARVEQSMFGQTFNTEDENKRINRISSAFNAQKSANKYDSNKFTQNMSTAMQIGTMILMLLACIL